MKKIVAKNFFLLTMGEFIARFFTFFLTIGVARILGAQGLGQFSFAMSVLAYFTFFTDFGLTLLGTREIAAEKNEANKIGTNVLFLQLVLSVVLMCILFLLTPFISPDKTTKNLIIILGLGLVPFALNVNYIFLAFQRMEFAALIKVIIQMTYVILALIFLFLFKNVTYAAVSNVIGNLVGAVISIILVVKVFSFKFEGFSRDFSRRLFIQAIPMGISAFLVQVFFNFDTLAIGFIKGTTAVGFYSAAYKLMLVINSFGFSYFATLFPIFSEKFKEGDLKKIKDVGETSLRILFFISLPVIVGVVLTAHLIVPIFLGSEFNQSILILQILVFNIVLIWLNNLFGGLLITGKRQKLELLAVATGAFVNIILNIILIPKFGILGAAFVSVLSQFIHLSLAYYFVFRKVRLNVFKTIFKPLFNSFLMLVILSIIFSHQKNNIRTLLIEVAVGVLIYGFLSVVTKGIPKQEDFFTQGKKVLNDLLVTKEEIK